MSKIKTSTKTKKDGRAIRADKAEGALSKMRGLGQDVWASLGGSSKYLKKERLSWGKRGRDL